MSPHLALDILKEVDERARFLPAFYQLSPQIVRKHNLWSEIFGPGVDESLITKFLYQAPIELATVQNYWQF